MSREPEKTPLHDADDDDVPKIGRGRSRYRFPQKEIVTIFAMIICLIAVLALRKGCANGVANMFRAFELDAGPPGAADAGPKR